MKGAIRWMAGNHVAANILMFSLVVGGLLIGQNVKQEVFPEVDLDMVSIQVVYPGASPIEVEDGIIRPIELAISGVDNIKRIVANSNENVGLVSVEVVENADPVQVWNDIKSEIDRIRTFPEEAEDPIISLVTNRREVMSLVVSGDASERALEETCERVRDDLLANPEITQVEISAVRPYEISVEVSETELRRYHLTLNQVAAVIRRASLDMGGGLVKTEGGDVLLRTSEKRYWGTEFDSVAVLTKPDGERVLLGDIAHVKDDFMEYDRETYFDGKPAAMVQVFRVGDQKPTVIAKVVKQYLADVKDKLPTSIKVDVWRDWSDLLQQRLDLLLRNGRLGLLLVLITLALFLEIRLAFWVAMGIVISFMGALFVMPLINVSINMISLFAFITVLGVVVDDAIIVGENIFVHRNMGKSIAKSSMDGTIEISNAVIFAVLTTVVAFAPLMFVKGVMGKFFWVIPAIIITVLMMSLVESLLILPAHLSGGLIKNRAPFWGKIERFRKRFDRMVVWFVDHSYRPTLHWVQKNRYITLTMAIAILFTTVGIVAGGFVKFVFMPEVEADNVEVNLTLAPGTPFAKTSEISKMIEAKGMELVEEYDAKRSDGRSNLEHLFVAVGQQVVMGGPHGSNTSNASNISQLQMLFLGEDERNLDVASFADEWRQRVGEIPGVEKLTFKSLLMNSGDDIDIQLAHSDYDVLLPAMDRLKAELEKYSGVNEVNDSYIPGKRELKLQLRPEAAALGITESDLALQVRGAFYGSEAVRIQRGQNEVKVMVRYPEDERESVANIENMRIRTRQGGEIPLYQAAYVTETTGYSSIQRTDRKRTVHVTANVDERATTSNEVLRDMKNGILAKLVSDYPGLSYDLEGQSRNQRESMGSLAIGFLLAQFLIYALLAVLFKSYTQPFVVMSAIPFGIVGAILGHILLGYNLSLISAMGIVALTGVVVNDSLVMIDFINRARREEGLSLKEAVMQSGVRRFRPIIMTSLTTFLGLTPIILETSMQAKFMIPMAISLGFGVLFATGITLILIPALYLVLEDILELLGRGAKDEDDSSEMLPESGEPGISHL